MAAKAEVQKIIIIGDAKGNFDDIFSRINTIHTKHGPFSAAFCVGNFFGDDVSQLNPFILKQKTIALPTYFIVSDDQDTSLIDCLTDTNDGGEICPNLTFLGRSGIKQINGLNVAYLSGLYDAKLFNKTASEIRTILALQEIENNKDTKESTTEDLQCTKAAKEFRTNYCLNDIKKIKTMNVDLLLTAEWGKLFHLAIVHEFDKKSIVSCKIPLQELVSFGTSPIVNKLAVQLSPQYHFAANNDLFFRLLPYKTKDDSSYLSRFIALGEVPSETKQRSIYACNITPLLSHQNSSLLY